MSVRDCKAKDRTSDSKKFSSDWLVNSSCQTIDITVRIIHTLCLSRTVMLSKMKGVMFCSELSTNLFVHLKSVICGWPTEKVIIKISSWRRKAKSYRDGVRLVEARFIHVSYRDKILTTVAVLKHYVSRTKVHFTPTNLLPQCHSQAFQKLHSI